MNEIELSLPDGTDAPDVLDHEVAGLTTDALYAFKVQPFNLLGGGVLSRASLTVAARAGMDPKGGRARRRAARAWRGVRPRRRQRGSRLTVHLELPAQYLRRQRTRT